MSLPIIAVSSKSNESSRHRLAVIVGSWDIDRQQHAIDHLNDTIEDRGIYIVEGEIEIAGTRFESGRMMVFRPGDPITLTAKKPTRLMLLGGETLSGPRYIWWNFVASSEEKIEAAKEAWREGDWQHGRFQLPPDDQDEFIPAPER